MKRTPYIRITLSCVCLAISFLFQGCSIFGPVGHAISQGYENSVSYFNGYYNAKSLFDEAEDEIRLDALKKRGQESSTAPIDQIPGSAKDKLLKVIDKCSNILTFHSTSALVDDALMLIGKSFYYQAEYLKAERKFSELFVQYPSSPLVLETQLWYARTEEKLEKFEAGIQMCDSAISTAKANDDIEIETQAHQILGRLYLQMHQPDKAVLEYEKEISISNDDDIKAEAQMNLGSIYFSGGQYEKAAETYLRVSEYTSDIYSIYYSNVQAVIAYRESKEYKKGLTLVDAMIENFRYKSYLPHLLFERANIYVASGKNDEAIDEYIYVDTAYTKSEYALHSAYQLGILYEKQIGDYQSALKYYSEVNLASGLKFVADGKLKYAALTRFFEARKRLEAADSLIFVLTDTTRKTISDTLAAKLTDTTVQNGEQVVAQTNPSAADSSRTLSDSIKPAIETDVSRLVHSRSDSLKMLHALLDSTQRTISQTSSRRSRIGADSLATLKAIADSLKKKISRVSSQLAASGVDSLQKSNTQTVSSRVLLSADSLAVLKSIAAQDLADIYYTELVVPDSAFTWYEKSLAWNYSSIRSPRILYILAELSRMNSEKKYPTPEEYYTRLDHDFPESIYAEEARRFLGKESSVKKTDDAAMYYEQAEKLIDTKQHKNAIKTLRSIAQSYPKSPLAAKSEFAIAWIYDSHLAQPDSARVQYNYVMKKYNGTKYAVAAANRSARIIQVDTLKSDTAKVTVLKSDTSRTYNTARDTSKINAMKVDSVKINNRTPEISKNTRIDTAITNVVKIDTSKTKTTDKDSSEFHSRMLNKRIPNEVGVRKDSLVSRKKVKE